jgi:hypothetical protein
MGRNKIETSQVRKMYWAPRLTIKERESIIDACDKLSRKTGYRVTPSEFMRKAALEGAKNYKHYPDK